MNKSKAETFIGFAVRARKFRAGENTLATLKKIYLVIVCKTASENARKNAWKYAAKHKCPVMITAQETLENLAHIGGIKLSAVTDRALAEAIIKNYSPDFEYYNNIGEENS